MTLTELADEAVSHWNGSVTRLLRNRENAVFEVALPTGRAALRLHRQGYQDDAAIRSELWWCAALAREGVAVPAALPSRSGDFLVKLFNGRNASIIRWIEGDAFGEAGKPLPCAPEDRLTRHFALGQLLASVHSATDRLTLPPDFTRPCWDTAGLVGEAPFWGRFWEHPAAEPAQAEILRQARKFLRDQITDHQQQGGDFGPIHADVLRENVLVKAGSLSLIDFDDSGFGFRLYDLGTALSQNLYEPDYPQIRDALVAGYAETRPASFRMAEVFTLARCCASVGWAAPRLAPDDPIHKSHIARAVMCAQAVLV
ncbi:MAG: phosphotransferase [Cypionkella sp.]|uniref:phosphotransferase enzyme family protein n=1 Tax=Cypionkella sp. TaxID=2811411 RepID=UPI002ABB1B9D|nr:phosphotransferase [Cypionkella sp.]MDZ4309091.1 phosphotransferase [Cypionkella sp.]MDZ4395507.1 phosphotransferase [Cypionkella sp.]